MYGFIIAHVHSVASGSSRILGLLAILGTFALYAIVVVVLVPVMFLAVALFASFIVAIAEGHGPLDSLRESYTLVRSIGGERSRCWRS